MPPNSVDLITDPEMMSQNHETKPGSVSRPQQIPAGNSSIQSDENYKLRIFQSSINLLATVLMGSVLAIGFIFAFRNGLPLNATSLHLALCIPGYQLLMGQAILSLSSNTDWSARFRLVDKRRAHWILQLLGSALVISGSFIKILDKQVHWNTLHGKFALVALVFTSVSLFNGLASLWAFELKKFVPMNVSKLTHICFGTVAFVASSICLCYGLEKANFRSWSTDGIAYTFIGFVSFYTFVVIINPVVTFYNKSKGVLKNE